MKKITYILSGIAALVLSISCSNLDLNPLSAASSGNWYSDADEIRLSVNDLYRTYLYEMNEEYWTDRRTDDWAQREQVYELCNGSVTSTTSTFSSYWFNTYKGISRANRVIEAVEQKHGDSPGLSTLKAEAKFFRAYFYARLIILWGDVPYYTSGSPTIEEAMAMGRTDKDLIKDHIIKDFDYAIENLPEDNTQDGTWRVNRWTAMALKARFCINMKDYETTAALCKKIMDDGPYSLYYSTKNPADSYGELFRDKTMNTEILWSIPYSYSLGVTENIKSWVLRTAGGNAVAQPSWDLLAAYECTDGKPIDESPLFDCHNPFLNRDPRCAMTFVVPGTFIYGVEFNPAPTATTVLKDGESVKNKDTRVNDNYCAFNSCCIRKGAQEEWRTPMYNENPWIIIRLADVMLMYAEAQCELGKIDPSVLEAINKVRARAYGVSVKDTGSYPQITETDQTKLRRIIRKERRVEFAWEGRRWFDVRRWGWLEKMYSIHYYGHLNATDLKQYYKDGNWFWPYTPEIDEDGFADFTKMFDDKLISLYGFHKYDSKIELWPIPNDDVEINKNLKQNPGY